MSERAIQDEDEKRFARVCSEVIRVLGCINDGADHYKVLGISHDASIEDIRESYRRAVENLHPLKCRDVIEIDGSMQWRLSQAFLRVLEAFTTLSRPARRIEYDGILNRRPTAPLPLPRWPEIGKPGTGIEVRYGRSPGELSPGRPSLGSAFGLSEGSIPRAPDRRRVIRFALRLPVRVTSSDGQWQEVTESCDVSRLGIRIRLLREVEPGALLRLELPMPAYLRLHSHSETVYFIGAVVRYVTPANGKDQVVGAEFIPDSTAISSDATRSDDQQA